VPVEVGGGVLVEAEDGHSGRDEGAEVGASEGGVVSRLDAQRSEEFGDFGEGREGLGRDSRGDAEGAAGAEVGFSGEDVLRNSAACSLA
jgi:hypothetical protein